MFGLRVLLSALYTATFTQAVVATQIQAPFFQARPATTTILDIEIKSLSALSTDEFTKIRHPYFPRHSARIKKTEWDCDENVKYVPILL